MLYDNTPTRDFIRDNFAGKTGSLLEIGAFDGQTNSLSRWFIENGWTATLVEPNPKVFCDLLNLYGAHPGVQLVHAAVNVTPGVQVFHDDGGGQESTLDPEHKADSLKRWPEKRFRPYWVRSLGPEELLSVVPPVDLILVDAEGLSGDIAFFLREKANLLCVETTDQDLLKPDMLPVFTCFPDIVFAHV